MKDKCIYSVGAMKDGIDFVKLLNGDNDEFAKFYEAYKRSVYYNVLSILKDKDLAEDALMETFVKFLENRSKINPKKSIDGYLMMISRNVALDMIKQRSREVELDEDSDNYIGKNDPGIQGEVIERMSKILNSSEMEIVVLHVVNEYSHKEIAQMLHRPLGTITWAYNNALKKLKEGFKDYER